MYQANITDRAKVVDIIAKTFKDNPGVNGMFSIKANRLKKKLDGSPIMRL